MGVASLVLKPRLPKFVKSHNFKRYISDMISIKIVPLISDLGKTPLSVPSIFKGVLGLCHNSQSIMTFFKVFILLGIINICWSSPASVAQTPPQYYYPPQFHENEGIVENVKQYVSKP